MKLVRSTIATPATGGDRLDRELALLARPVWEPVFRACAEQIRSAGAVKGAITISDPAVVNAVEGMGCAVRRGRMKLRDLDAAMRSGRLVEGLLAATERWIGMAIVTKREERDQQQAAWNALRDGWRELIQQPLPPDVDATLPDVLNAWLTTTSPWIKGRWRKTPTRIDRAVRRAIDAARRAPGVGVNAAPIPLPIFAHQLTGNPHAFDAGRMAGRLAISAMRARFASDVGTWSGTGAEMRAAVLDAAGLSNDGISSRVVTFGLAGAHPLFAAAASMREPLTLSSLNLEHMGVVAAPTGTVYVVENPSVFAQLLREFALTTSDSSTVPSIVCTSGQFGVTAAMLLDRLAAGGATIRYSGDFDRDGVVIADRCIRRYPNRCMPWRMDIDSYHLAKAHRPQNEHGAIGTTASTWNDERPALLEAIEYGGVAYQEALIEVLAEDIRRSVAITAPTSS